MDFLDLADKKIDQMPPLPKTILKIQEICSNPESSVKELTKVVETDPILTAKILKVANSPYYGFASKVNSINHAISLLGMNTILGFALDIHLKKHVKINLSPYNLTLDEFSLSSHKQCKLMMMWHFNLNLKQSDILVITAFLNEIGKTILAQIIIENNLKEDFYEKVKDLNIMDEVIEVEKEFFGINSLEITGKIFYKWRLNILMSYSVLASINPEKSDENLSRYGYALKIVRTAIGQRGIVTREQLDNALNLLDKADFNKKYFLLALNSIL